MTTIDDVARAAGVSVSTVSYALSGKRPISASTRERIERAVRDLDYRPHAGARALASQRTNVLALMAPLRVDVNVGVIMQFVTGVVTRAQTYQHDVLLLTQDDHAGVERVAAGSMVDAVIMMDVEADDPRLPILRRQRQPAVLIGLPRDTAGFSCVDLDFESVGPHRRRPPRRASGTGRSRSSAHRRPCSTGTPPTPRAWCAGFREETARLGRRRRCSSRASPRTPARSPRVDRVLDRLPGVTGLVVHNEVALPAVLAALRERGDRRAARHLRGRRLPAPTSRSVSRSSSRPSTSRRPRSAASRSTWSMARLDDGQRAETRLLSPVLTRRATTTAPAGLISHAPPRSTRTGRSSASVTSTSARRPAASAPMSRSAEHVRGCRRRGAARRPRAGRPRATTCRTTSSRCATPPAIAPRPSLDDARDAVRRRARPSGRAGSRRPASPRQPSRP